MIDYCQFFTEYPAMDSDTELFIAFCTQNRNALQCGITHSEVSHILSGTQPDGGFGYPEL